jgi:uncharacterized protein (TIGR03084 family)
MISICEDLGKEQESLDEIVCGLEEEQWLQPTMFSGWSVRDEITHLAFFDRAAALAATNESAFNAMRDESLKGVTSPEEFHDRVLAYGRTIRAAELLSWWRVERSRLLKALAPLDIKTRLPWWGPSMSARSCATARLMETWAHGADVADALGVRRKPSERLYNIAHMGVITMGWSYATNGMETPNVPVRVELTGPAGEAWNWGPEDAVNVVRGDAEEFCLVAVRRRHVNDTVLSVTGPIAVQWLSIAQAFAGPPEPAPPPGSYPKNAVQHGR